MALDYYIFSLMNQYAGQYSILDSVLFFFSEYLIILLLLFFLIEFRNVKAVLTAVASVMAGLAVNILISMAYFRPRPFVEHKVNLLVSYAPTSSFPSDHATVSFALATAVFLHNRALGVIAYGIAIAVSVSRIFAGLHYPLDILGGAVLGSGLSLLAYLVIKRFGARIGVDQ
ncbi:MAG: phosphatase PAP2 family protein [Candidatus Woesearchaeota archaeon]